MANAKRRDGPTAGKPSRPLSLYAAIQQLLQQHGEMTIAQMRAELECLIPAARAIAKGRTSINYKIRSSKYRYVTPPQNSTLSRVLRIGRQVLFNQALSSLVKRHKIRRISQGVYGPPLPHLFKEK